MTFITMAILNLTPDSFWAGSRALSVRQAARKVSKYLAAGAEIIDIGAVSTRPGAEGVDVGTEWKRLQPVLSAIDSGRIAIPEKVRISIDTTSAEIVRLAYGVIGDFIVNDISAGEDDPQMLSTVGELGLTYIAMHKRGNPQTMDSLCDYPQGVVPAVVDYFREFETRAAQAGITDWILDPGFGFAKTDDQNLEMLDNLMVFKQFNKPILVGIAHKRFTHGRTEELQEQAVANGADILRVHI